MQYARYRRTNTPWSYVDVESEKIDLAEADIKMAVTRGWGVGDAEKERVGQRVQGFS